MGEIVLKMHVSLRDEMGRFIAACDAAATKTVEDLINQGASMSRALAPVKTGALSGSIEAHMTSSRSGEWYANTKYAMPQEFGAGPHGLPGNVSFFWENQGRMWEPGANEIQHPGNPPHPYLRPAYEAVMGKAVSVAAANYPG